MLVPVSMHKAEKYALDKKALTDERLVFLMQNCGCARKVYNLYVSWLYDILEKQGFKPGDTIDVKLPEVTVFKKEFPFLKEADSLALANAKDDFSKAIERFNKQDDRSTYTKRALRRAESGTEPLSFRGLKGMPKFHARRMGYVSYTTNCQYPSESNDLKNPTIHLEDDMLYVPKHKQGLKLIIHRKLPEGAILTHVTFSMDTDGKFYASISYSYTIVMDMTLRHAVTSGVDQNVIDNLSFIGLDYAQEDFYVDSEGRKANYPHYYRMSEEKLGKLQKKLSRMTKDSENYKRMLAKVQKCSAHIKNQRLDFIRKEANYLAKSYDVVVVEDINLRAMGSTLSLGKNLHDNGFGMFRNILARKLEEKGSVLVKIDRFFPSSQTCHICGHKDPKTKDLSVREWTCPKCGTHHDRDHNAAENIRDEGKRVFAEYFSNWLTKDEKSRKKAASLSSARKKKKAA